MKLYVSVNVQNEGYLSNATIELVDTNFSFKNKPEIASFNLDSIQAEDGITLPIPIIAKKDESYNLRLLNMQSQIKLTGEYIDASGNVTDIDTTKALKIIWTSNELTEEDIVLSQEVITNKIYNIDGVNKRVIQLLVKSQIQGNKVPVKSSVIEISNPEIGAVPEEVKVASYGTQATNGKTSLWSSKSAEGKTTIEVLNNPEESIVSWTKNAQDIFVVTYIYDEETAVTPFVSNAKSTIDIYGRTKTTIQKTSNLTLEELTEGGNIINLETSITENIYKGKMYIGQDTNYKTTSKIYIPYSEIVDGVIYSETADEIAEGISTYYKTTKINKADAKKVLGEEGRIAICNGENFTTPIYTINLATEESEGDYYIVQYPENISRINIIMGNVEQLEENVAVKPLASEGIIEIINEKVIKVTNIEGVAELTELNTNFGLHAIDIRENNLVNNTVSSVLQGIINKSSTANLVEPKTTFDISLDTTSISALSDNDLRITAELITKDESNKLFKSSENNPIVINIELPQEIQETSIQNITPVVGNDELEIKSYNVTTNEVGNKVITIEIEGEQTAYIENSATIVIDTKIKTNNFMADRNVEIKTTVINDAETVEKANGLKIISKAGLVTKSTIIIEENIVEKINLNNVSLDATAGEEVQITTGIINNYGDILSNGTIIGTIPADGVLKETVTTNIESAVVYYSEETNPSINSESWKTEVTDFSNIKSFKIVGLELAQGAGMALSYKYALNQTATVAQESTIKVNGTVAKETKEETITYTSNIDATNKPTQDEAIEESINGLNIVLKSKTKTDIIHEGQIITYNIKVTNRSSETLNNVVLSYAIPEGATYTELTYAQAIDIRYTDNEELISKDWNIETLAPNKSIEKEVTIRIKEGTKQIVNKVSLKDEQEHTLIETTSEPIQVKESKISVMLSRRDNMSIQLDEGSIIKYYVIIKNISDETLNNLTISSDIPKNTTYVENSDDNENWSYNNKENKAYYVVDKIEPNETQFVILEIKINKFDNNTTLAQIENSVLVKDNNSDTYESNIFTSKIRTARWNITQKSEHDYTLREGDLVKYIIEIKNIGQRGGRAYVKDSIPEEIQLIGIKTYIDEVLMQEKDLFDTNEIELDEYIEFGETLKIEIQGVTKDLEDTVKSKEIKNIAKIDLGDDEFLESEEIINTIVNDVVSAPEEDGDSGVKDPDVDSDIDQDPNETKKYSISGFAWLDENKDGIQDEEEKNMQALEIILIDKEGKQIAKTVTSLTGTYKFNDIEQGEYKVIFKYDTSKYTVTKYQSSNATEETNSDVITKEVEINGETSLVATTDTIKITDKNITNIDMGLIENAKFDLSLNKYINKVILINDAGTTTYEYQDTTLAKVEISSKRIEGTVIIIDYELEITNEGDVDAYIEDIIDYIPDDLEFTSDTNEDWYMDGDGVLHNKALAQQIIKAGETKSVKLVLTKTLKSDSTGIIENIGEIAQSSNLAGIEEYDSTAGNKQLGEDDMSSASLIISISTGSPIMYIGIVLGSMLVLGLGIYLINKKVLKGGI